MGVVPDESNLYPELTGLENLCFCGALYGMARRDRVARARDLLDRFGLTEAAGRKFAGRSRGMKRKLTTAAGMIHHPPILFLDEPTSGIDVASARRIRQLLAELHRCGTAIFPTTHYIEEAERLCRRVAFIVGGRIVGTDTVERLVAAGGPARRGAHPGCYRPPIWSHSRIGIKEPLRDRRNGARFGSAYGSTSGLWLKDRGKWTRTQRHLHQTLPHRGLKTARAWTIKESLREIYAARLNLPEATRLLGKWYGWAIRSRLEPVKRVARTIKEHRDGVLRVFETGATTALLEGVNSLIQAAKARARGYGTTRHLIASAYLIAGKLRHLPRSPYAARCCGARAP